MSCSAYLGNFVIICLSQTQHVVNGAHEYPSCNKHFWFLIPKILIWKYYLRRSVEVKMSPFMVTSSNGNTVRVTGLLFVEFTGHRWFPCTKTSDVIGQLGHCDSSDQLELVVWLHNQLIDPMIRDPACNIPSIRCAIHLTFQLWYPLFKLFIAVTAHVRHVVSNHRSVDCLFNSIFVPTSKKPQSPH